MTERMITYFDLATGLIQCSGLAKVGQEDENIRPGLGWTNGIHDPATHRINPATKRANQLPALPITVADGQITGIPAGTDAIIRNERVRIDDGAIIFDPSHGLEETVAVTLVNPAFREIAEPVMVLCASS